MVRNKKMEPNLGRLNLVLCLYVLYIATTLLSVNIIGIVTIFKHLWLHWANSSQEVDDQS